MGHFRIVRNRGKDPVQRERLRMHGRGAHCPLDCLAPLWGVGVVPIHLPAVPASAPQGYSRLQVLALATHWAWKILPPDFPEVTPSSLPGLGFSGDTSSESLPFPPGYFKWLELPSSLYLPISPYYSPIAFINRGLGIYSFLSVSSHGTVSSVRVRPSLPCPLAGT